MLEPKRDLKGATPEKLARALPRPVKPQPRLADRPPRQAAANDPRRSSRDRVRSPGRQED